MTSVLENKLKKVNDVLNNSVETADMSGEREFVSGEVVEPGVYVDVESGAVIRVAQADELPEGRMVIRYDRRFRKIESSIEALSSEALSSIETLHSPARAA